MDIRNKLIDPYAQIKMRNHSHPLIYFLFNGDDLVYVGKTTKGLARVYQHTDKAFTHIVIQYCSLEYLDELEQAYIVIYKPKYNIVVPSKLHEWSYASMTYEGYHSSSYSVSKSPRQYAPTRHRENHSSRVSMYRLLRDGFSDGLGI